MPLSEIELQTEYRSDLDNLARDFLAPCLQRSISYRRAVGYFTSAGLSLAARGLRPFIDAGGSMQLIASPLLDEKDFDAIQRGEKAREDIIELSLLRELTKEFDNRNVSRFSLLSWLIAEDMLEIKLAVPVTADGNYRSGIYHEKIGIFSDTDKNAVAFTGSPNETHGGLISNFESIDVFWSWDDPHGRVDRKKDNFDRLWSNHTAGLKVLELPEVVRRKLLEFREESERRRLSNITLADEPYRFSEGLWDHQSAAVDAFLTAKQGILEMATGTGKTRTSLAIAELLLDEKKIDTVVIVADGPDLLDQWSSDVLTLGQSRIPAMTLYKHYGENKEIDEFLMGSQGSILLVSRYFLPRALKRLDKKSRENLLLIHDEVHALGSPSNREKLVGLSDGISYRMGLSATPEREYDDDGNDFVTAHIGSVVYEYQLSNAIEDGILAPFDYFPLDYWPNDDDAERISNVYKKVAARRKEGNPMSKAEIWTDLARVYKTSRAKLPVFSDFLEQHPEVLDRSIIFVETIEYGKEVLDIIHRYKPDFHTYFGGEDQTVLERFARGDLECVLTCHRLSEGIDIRSLKNVILFSSARARLEMIQRIGRCLRIDPLDPGKRAGIVDFIRADQSATTDDDEHTPADQLRKEWLTELSKIRQEDS